MLGSLLAHQLTIAPIPPAEAVLDWYQTTDEVIIMLLVSANAQSQHVQYKLTPTHLEITEQGISLIRATLPHPVQVEDSNWQFGKSVSTGVYAGTWHCYVLWSHSAGAPHRFFLCWVVSILVIMYTDCLMLQIHIRE